MTLAGALDACPDDCRPPRGPTASPPRLTDDYVDWLQCTMQAPAVTDNAETCDGLCSAHTTIVDGVSQPVPGHASMGTVGPQPTVPPCLHCGAVMRLEDRSLDAWVKLRGSLPPNTTFKAATIELVHVNRANQIITMPYEQVDKWKAGDTLWVQSEMSKESVQADWSQSKAVFRARIVPSSGAEYDKVAVIPLSVKP